VRRGDAERSECPPACEYPPSSERPPKVAKQKQAEGYLPAPASVLPLACIVGLSSSTAPPGRRDSLPEGHNIRQEEAV